MCCEWYYKIKNLKVKKNLICLKNHRRYNVWRKSSTSCRNKTFNKQIECLKNFVEKSSENLHERHQGAFPLFPQLFAAYQYKWALERWKKLGCSIISHGQSEILKRRGTFHLKIVRANLHVDVAIVSIKGSKTIGKKTYFRFYNVDFSWKLLARGKTFFQAVISLLTKWNGHNLSRFESLTFCGRSFSWNKLTYVGEVSVKRLFL